MSGVMEVRQIIPACPSPHSSIVYTKFLNYEFLAFATESNVVITNLDFVVFQTLDLCWDQILNSKNSQASTSSNSPKKASRRLPITYLEWQPNETGVLAICVGNCLLLFHPVSRKEILKKASQHAKHWCSQLEAFFSQKMDTQNEEQVENKKLDYYQTKGCSMNYHPVFVPPEILSDSAIRVPPYSSQNDLDIDDLIFQERMMMVLDDEISCMSFSHFPKQNEYLLTAAGLQLILWKLRSQETSDAFNEKDKQGLIKYYNSSLSNDKDVCTQSESHGFDDQEENENDLPHSLSGGQTNTKQKIDRIKYPYGLVPDWLAPTLKDPFFEPRCLYRQLWVQSLLPVQSVVFSSDDRFFASTGYHDVTIKVSFYGSNGLNFVYLNHAHAVLDIKWRQNEMQTPSKCHVLLTQTVDGNCYLWEESGLYQRLQFTLKARLMHPSNSVHWMTMSMNLKHEIDEILTWLRHHRQSTYDGEAANYPMDGQEEQSDSHSDAVTIGNTFDCLHRPTLCQPSDYLLSEQQPSSFTQVLKQCVDYVIIILDDGGLIVYKIEKLGIGCPSTPTVKKWISLKHALYPPPGPNRLNALLISQPPVQNRSVFVPSKLHLYLNTFTKSYVSKWEIDFSNYENGEPNSNLITRLRGHSDSIHQLCGHAALPLVASISQAETVVWQVSDTHLQNRTNILSDRCKLPACKLATWDLSVPILYMLVGQSTCSDEHVKQPAVKRQPSKKHSQSSSTPLDSEVKDTANGNIQPSHPEYSATSDSGAVRSSSSASSDRLAAYYVNYSDTLDASTMSFTKLISCFADAASSTGPTSGEFFRLKYLETLHPLYFDAEGKCRLLPKNETFIFGLSEDGRTFFLWKIFKNQSLLKPTSLNSARNQSNEGSSSRASPSLETKNILSYRLPDAICISALTRASASYSSNTESLQARASLFTGTTDGTVHAWRLIGRQKEGFHEGERESGHEWYWIPFLCFRAHEAPVKLIKCASISRMATAADASDKVKIWECESAPPSFSLEAEISVRPFADKDAADAQGSSSNSLANLYGKNERLSAFIYSLPYRRNSSSFARKADSAHQLSEQSVVSEEGVKEDFPDDNGQQLTLASIDWEACLFGGAFRTHYPASVRENVLNVVDRWFEQFKESVKMELRRTATEHAGRSGRKRRQGHAQKGGHTRQPYGRHSKHNVLSKSSADKKIPISVSDQQMVGGGFGVSLDEPFLALDDLGSINGPNRSRIVDKQNRVARSVDLLHAFLNRFREDSAVRLAPRSLTVAPSSETDLWFDWTKSHSGIPLLAVTMSCATSVWCLNNAIEYPFRFQPAWDCLAQSPVRGSQCLWTGFGQLLLAKDGQMQVFSDSSFCRSVSRLAEMRHLEAPHYHPRALLEWVLLGRLDRAHVILKALQRELKSVSELRKTTRQPADEGNSDSAEGGQERPSEEGDELSDETRRFPNLSIPQFEISDLLKTEDLDSSPASGDSGAPLSGDYHNLSQPQSVSQDYLRDAPVLDRNSLESSTLESRAASPDFDDFDMDYTKLPSVLNVGFKSDWLETASYAEESELSPAEVEKAGRQEITDAIDYSRAQSDVGLGAHLDDSGPLYSKLVKIQDFNWNFEVVSHEEAEQLLEWLNRELLPDLTPEEQEDLMALIKSVTQIEDMWKDIAAVRAAFIIRLFFLFFESGRLHRVDLESLLPLLWRWAIHVLEKYTFLEYLMSAIRRAVKSNEGQSREAVRPYQAPDSPSYRRSYLFTYIPEPKGAGSADVFWPLIRSFGIPLWCNNDAYLVQLCNELAVYSYKLNNNPSDSCLWYLLLNKASVLAAMYRLNGDANVHRFLSNDFTQSRWINAARDNASVLLSKQKFQMAAGFFVLGGKLKEAVDICLYRLNDWMLALFVSRIIDRLNPYAKGSSQTRYVLGLVFEMAKKAGQYHIESIVLWILKNYQDSLKCLVPKFPRAQFLLPCKLKVNTRCYFDQYPTAEQGSVDRLGSVYDRFDFSLREERVFFCPSKAESFFPTFKFTPGTRGLFAFLLEYLKILCASGQASEPGPPGASTFFQYLDFVHASGAFSSAQANPYEEQSLSSARGAQTGLRQFVAHQQRMKNLIQRSLLYRYFHTGLGFFAVQMNLDELHERVEALCGALPSKGRLSQGAGVFNASERCVEDNLGTKEVDEGLTFRCVVQFLRQFFDRKRATGHSMPDSRQLKQFLHLILKYHRALKLKAIEDAFRLAFEQESRPYSFLVFASSVFADATGPDYQVRGGGGARGESCPRAVGQGHAVEDRWPLNSAGLQDASAFSTQLICMAQKFASICSAQIAGLLSPGQGRVIFRFTRELERCLAWYLSDSTRRLSAKACMGVWVNIRLGYLLAFWALRDYRGLKQLVWGGSAEASRSGKEVARADSPDEEGRPGDSSSDEESLRAGFRRLESKYGLSCPIVASDRPLVEEKCDLSSARQSPSSTLALSLYLYYLNPLLLALLLVKFTSQQYSLLSRVFAEPNSLTHIRVLDAWVEHTEQQLKHVPYSLMALCLYRILEDPASFCLDLELLRPLIERSCSIQADEPLKDLWLALSGERTVNSYLKRAAFLQELKNYVLYNELWKRVLEERQDILNARMKRSCWELDVVGRAEDRPSAPRADSEAEDAFGRSEAILEDSRAAWDARTSLLIEQENCSDHVRPQFSEFGQVELIHNVKEPVNCFVFNRRDPSQVVVTTNSQMSQLKLDCPPTKNSVSSICNLGLFYNSDHEAGCERPSDQIYEPRLVGPLQWSKKSILYHKHWLSSGPSSRDQAQPNGRAASASHRRSSKQLPSQLGAPHKLESSPTADAVHYVHKEQFAYEENASLVCSHPVYPYFLSSSHDGSLGLWQFQVRQKTFVFQHRSYIKNQSAACIRYNCNGSKFASLGHAGTLGVWSSDFECMMAEPYFVNSSLKKGHDFCFLNAGTVLAVAGDAGNGGGQNVVLIDTLLPQESAAVMKLSTPLDVHSLQYVQKSQLLIMGDSKGHLSVYDLRMDKMLRQAQAHESVIRCMCTDPTQSYLITASKSGSVKMWEVNGSTLAEKASWREAHVVRGLSAKTGFSKNGVTCLQVQDNYLYSSGADGTIKRRMIHYK